MKRTWTRKKKALCWLAAAVGLWACCLWVNSPGRVARRQAQWAGVWDGEIVAQAGELPLEGPKRRVYLVADGDHVLLSVVERGFLLGWKEHTVLPLECRKWETVHGNFWVAVGPEKAICYFYGRVDDGKVQSVEMVYSYEGVEKVVAASQRPLWHHWNGHDYFLAVVPLEDRRTSDHHLLYADGERIGEMNGWLSSGFFEE